MKADWLSCYILATFWLTQSAFVAQLTLSRHFKKRRSAQLRQSWRSASLREYKLPAPFNIREWPLFRVARSILILDEAEAIAHPDRTHPPLGMSVEDQHAQERARVRELADINDDVLHQQRDESAFWTSLDRQAYTEAQQDTERQQADELQRHLDALHDLQRDEDAENSYGW